MWLLTLGVLFWIVAHGFKPAFPNLRLELIALLGDEDKYKGLIAVLVLASVALMVGGWWLAEPYYWYFPPLWGKHVTYSLMLLCFYHFVASGAPVIYRRLNPHPLLTAVSLWSIGHLFANGDSRSVVLFGGFLIWSLACIFFINKRDRKAKGRWGCAANPKPEIEVKASAEVQAVLATVLVTAIFFALHRFYSGIPLMALPFFN